MENEQKTHQRKQAVSQTEAFITTEEKAQYEVFTNGNLPRETIEKWIRNDLSAIQSFVHGCLNDKTVFEAVVDAYYNRYKKLHGPIANEEK